MVSGLTAGFLLDRQWHWLRGEMDQSKRPALLALCRILADEHVPYAIIGGLAQMGTELLFSAESYHSEEVSEPGTGEEKLRPQ